MIGSALSLWIALLGADRIDFLGGAGPLLLSPFYLLTPVVLVVEGQRRRAAGRSWWPVVSRRGHVYAALLFALLTIAAASVVVSRDVETSVGRLVLLAAIACGSALVAAMIQDDPNWRERVARGAAWGLLLSILLSTLQVLSYIEWLPSEWMVGSLRLRLDPYTYAGILPRPSGLTFDPNRGGLLFLTHWTLLGLREKPRRRWAIGVLLLLTLTLSRSALLAAGGYLLTSRQRSLRTTPRTTLAIAMASGTVALLLLLAPSPRERVGRFLAPLGERVSVSEGSSQTHTSLYRQGLTQATRDVPRTLVGVGYGTSYLLLRDEFGTNRYGNFHSLFLTLWVECGVVALLLGLALVFAPLGWALEWRPPLTAAIMFNVFYQSISEPAFWLLLALAWMTPAPPRGVRHP